MTTAELLKTVRRVEVRTNRLVNDTMVALLSNWFGCSRLVWFGFALLLLCSCSTQSHIVPAKQLPAEVSMNKEAGRGGHLTVMLKFNGEEFPFHVDTGAPITTFDKSLEGKLGKGYGSASIQLAGGGAKQNTKFHAAPKLFLGETQLALGKFVCTYEFKQPMGILGMDCLQHYCIQLDFEARKLRFLDSSNLKIDELGHCFPLTLKNDYPTIEGAGLISQSTNPLIDLGCNVDAAVDQGTNRLDGIYLPELQWNSQTYTDLIVAALEHANLIGLRFLARHLVTLDFPNRRIFLKQIRVDAIDDPDAESTRKSALRFLMKLREAGTLPGWMDASKGAIAFQSSTSSSSNTFKFWKQNDPVVCTYKVMRAGKTNNWELIKATRIDARGQLIEEHQIP
jgi:hypothetical protein